MLHPPNRYLTSCLCSHHNVPFRPAWSKIHQASCSRVCGKGVLLENKAGGRQKVGEPPWVCCGDPVIPGGLWPSSPCGAMDFSLAFLALCEAVNQHLLSAEWAMAGAETGLTTASGKNCPSSQLLCPCRGWEGFLSYGAHQLRVLFTASAAPETFHRGKALGLGEAEFSGLCSHWGFIACNL